MAKYTVEDIEILRQKSGISYEEAINLLEYHNGSLARALVDLEKNGRLRDVRPRHWGPWKREKKGGLLNYLYRMRLKVTKGDLTILNISSLFVVFTAISAFWVLIIGSVAAMVLGYRISIERNSPDFQADSLESLVRNASSNVKNSAFSIAQDLGMLDHNQPKTPKEEETPRTETAPSGTTPVTVQFPDGGSVNVKEGENGFHEADVH